ncbi:quinone-dependent dihydroorotate dehydrogenase [Leekyejoonella antrihumi]|uniref:Dihydroorotate dehydrogenase (quinone) n=1 Tax=Leekyejoonella antrihumi TaxID=1660198 RepID=A0A563DTA5_9MICO|nr:quinone-dependent dihydroorotate dehydrogenase [Leekyejoonella antrihumi]
MDVGYRSLLRPALFRIGSGDAEAAHLKTLQQVARLGDQPRALHAVQRLLHVPTSPVLVAGIEFPGRVGLAAGMDKDGVGVRAWGALGFGHVELGTVTARAQPGNDAPRLFRLRESRGVINRMGFNNHGAAALADRLRAAGPVGVPVGVSVGKTKVTPVEEAVEDYLASLRLLDEVADYLAVNVSSPNTPGLRSLQDKEPLAELLAELVTTAGRLARDRGVTPTPIFVKIAPDLTDGALDDVLEVVQHADVSGLIATNTTVGRDGIADGDLPLADETGGLSGAPLTRRARYVVERIAQRTKLPVIGVGGVMTAADGTALIDAGASLVQVYTGYIYRGPALVQELNRSLG